MQVVRMLLCLALAALHVEGLPVAELSQRDKVATMASVHLPPGAAARAYQAEVSAADAKEVLGV